MKPLSTLFVSVCLILCLIFFAASRPAGAGDIRKPVRAGTFYPADPAELKQLIDQLSDQAQKTRLKIPAGKALRALIMPHAGYIYSGWTAAHASLVISPHQFSKVVLLAPDHFIGFSDAAISDVSAYQTPLGLIKLHQDARKLRKQSDFFKPVPASDRKEHSLEVILPFLQAYLGDFELVPIVIGPTDIDKFASLIESICDPTTLLVASSDLSHFLPYSEAVAKDQQTINWITALESTEILKHQNVACGAVPIALLLNLAKRHQWHPLVLHYSNSGDTAGDRTRVVGYAAIAFFGDPIMQKDSDSGQYLQEDQGLVLLKLARQTIMEHLGKPVPESESAPVESALSDPFFQNYAGTFVTLKIDGRLRGCIGSLTANEPLCEGVRRNAVNAAFHDPRFSPLKARELDRVDIEVSILSKPRPLEYEDGADLLKKLNVNVDGVILRKGAASATFLPQVWEQLPKPEDFLSHLCMKAGLSSDAWRRTGLEVLTYQVQYFEEHK